VLFVCFSRIYLRHQIVFLVFPNLIIFFKFQTPFSSSSCLPCTVTLQRMLVKISMARKYPSTAGVSPRQLPNAQMSSSSWRVLPSNRSICLHTCLHAVLLPYICCAAANLPCSSKGQLESSMRMLTDIAVLQIMHAGKNLPGREISAVSPPPYPWL
jgi:hypothetical protein